jgi:2-polyprenyl-3-methyl-5-hydroxy-6-metoxy-1,4-benzoquinol methylase
MRKYKDGTFTKYISGNMPQFIKIMRKFFNNGWQQVVGEDDKSYYNSLRMWFHANVQSKFSREEIMQMRIRKRIQEFEEMFSKIGATATGKLYLDFGSGDASITSGLTRHFNFSAHACDVKAWHGMQHAPRHKNVKFKYVTRAGDIPFNTQFDIVSCLMVLHHLRNPINVIKDIHAHLKPGGLFILREHDVANRTTAELCDVEHALHDLVTDDKPQLYEEFVRDYIGDYHSKDYWQTVVGDIGFQCVYGSEPRGPTRYTYLVFRKV